MTRTHPTGNRCGHDPKNPQLSPPNPIRTSPGGLPRILSLAAERAKEWFWNPQKCQLLETNPDRQTRSERREAIQVVLEYLLSRLDLVTLCVGVPTLKDKRVLTKECHNVFDTSVDMKSGEKSHGQFDHVQRFGDDDRLSPEPGEPVPLPTVVPLNGHCAVFALE